MCGGYTSNVSDDSQFVEAPSTRPETIVKDDRPNHTTYVSGPGVAFHTIRDTAPSVELFGALVGGDNGTLVHNQDGSGCTVVLWDEASQVFNLLTTAFGPEEQALYHASKDEWEDYLSDPAIQDEAQSGVSRRARQELTDAFTR